VDWLTFFSTDIKSLAWPTAAIIALFVLKRQIADLLRALGNRLLTAKGGGFEFTFGERVDQVEESLPAQEQLKEITVSLSGSGQLEADAQRIENISELARLPPPYIVSQAWLRLEQAIRENLDYVLPTDARRPLSPLTYLELAREQGLVSEDEEPAIHRLREMRNLAAHSVDPGISITDALRYQDIAEAIIQRIKERKRPPRP
jgi:hypothetical protein